LRLTPATLTRSCSGKGAVTYAVSRMLTAWRRSCRIWFGNAIQHGSGTPVSLTAQEQGDSVTLAVHNGGPAIPPDVLTSVFEPLTRGRAEGGSQSIGLGLFIARAIVAAHGGDIQVSSSADEGTTFTVRLPKASSPVTCRQIQYTG
jgi:K+-sensing histidine kinase KdpD